MIIVTTNKLHLYLKFFLLYSFLLVILIPKSFAHGGLSLDEDYCVLTVGKYEMHFSGYQPENNGPKEFCEDIPETGNTIVVLDFMDDELRSLPVEVRIILDTEENNEDLESITVYKKDYKIYKNGTISLRKNFENKGKFIGYVTVKDENNFIISEFPFSVGIERKSSSYIYFIILALITGASLFYFGNKIRNKSLNA
ncbi:MAG: hypothetical protein P8J46_00650 [Alphaproteobacteria bacterium]|nr:hypothetical protein [Alphaproteobacteria bacterium]